MNIPHDPGAPGAAARDGQRDIRGVLIQVAGARLLLPNASIAEVLSYAEPEPVADAPEWLLGRIRWRGWPVPLVAAARMAGARAEGDERADLGTKVLVLKALGARPGLPYFAILSSGFPRLVTVSRAALEVEAAGVALPALVLARVVLNEERALVPDLHGMEARISEALEAVAAPSGGSATGEAGGATG